jgi:hypothetical protein
MWQSISFLQLTYSCMLIVYHQRGELGLIKSRHTRASAMCAAPLAELELSALRSSLIMLRNEILPLCVYAGTFPSFVTAPLWQLGHVRLLVS